MKKHLRGNGIPYRLKAAGSLVILVCIASLASLTQAQSEPPGLSDLVDQFNQANDIQVQNDDAAASAAEDDYGLRTYDKSRTQFDGVTHEMQVTYLTLGLDQGVELPVLSTGTTDVNIDFTIMMWFKIDENFNTRSVPGGVKPQIMYLFSFEDSVACFFTDTLTLMCDSWDRRKLQIPAGQIRPGIWYHLTLSSSAESDSYLLISDAHSEVAIDSVSNFGFRQNTLYGWKTCLGDCTADYGFLGGIREVVLMSKFVEPDQAERAKNLLLTYDSSIRAYFRFQDLHNKFMKDEFVDWPWLQFKGQPLGPSQYIGVDIIPNDVCPSLFQQISSLRFTADTRLKTLEMDTKLAQNEYSYTMSTTLMINETACVTFEPSQAAKDCNLVKLEGVFMMYLMGRNTARFHFFANKNYYESASSQIFIPYDQWVTIQLVVEHYVGYTIVISDQNGNAFYRTHVSQNMQEQWPTGDLTLFRAFDGFVEHFYLTKEAKQLNPFFAIDLRGDEDALINVLLTEQGYKNGGNAFRGIGKLRQKIKLEGEAIFEDVFFQVPSEGGNLAGTLMDEQKIFDGIACNDRHMTTHLNSSESYISFITPQLNEWSSANTIEFWFKIEDPAVYSQDVLLFSIVSSEKDPYLYYHVYIQNGDLKCAPFGKSQESHKDPIISFSDFSEENADTYGWWHVTCSYSFQQTARGTLFNTKIGMKSLEDTMIGLPKFYPSNSLIATFGKQRTNTYSLPGAHSVLVKEFRFWNKQLSLPTIETNRYRQIDPYKLPADYLLVYLRMATGSSLIDNFAARNQFYNQVDFSIQLNDLSYIEDFIEQEKYSYEPELDAVVAKRVRTYHTVCPVHSYYMNQYCYNEPVNLAVLAIFPAWDEAAEQLNWRFSLYHSSTIDHELITFLTDSWSSDDTILNDYFEESQTELDHLVPSRILRHESEYSIEAQLTNEELTFINSAGVKFVPSKCKWLTVVGSSVSDGGQFLQVSPGTQDITFQLELERNSAIDCDQFDFFDAFSGLDFQFLMTDTADYISYIPKMEVRPFNPDTNVGIAFGSATPTKLLVDVTLSRKEQEKLPVFQDIEILMTARWTSSKYATPVLTEDIVFQNLLYTIKFEPIANVLFADLVPSQTNIIREETLILDASDSYISNMPESQQRRSIAYQWECPKFLQAACSEKGGSQIAITYENVKDTAILYERPYEFKVTVIWAKPDGIEERLERTVSITWYDLVMPDFGIDYEESQLLITSTQNSLFYLEAFNFPIDDIYDYDVAWSLTPELANPNDRSVLSGGRIMQIIKGKYSKNTSYSLSLTVTHKRLDKLTQTREISFETLAPPVQGIVKVTPPEGFVGDNFTVVLQDWASANLPIEYNVYNTYTDSRKGALINEGGPIPIDEEFVFEATRTTPVVISVFDASGETLEFTITLQISLRPEDANNSDEAQDDGEAPGGADDTVRSPQNLLVQIGETQNFSQKVNYLTIAVETVNQIDINSNDVVNEVDIEEQISLRKELLNEMSKQTTEIRDRENNPVDPLSLSTRDFIMESFGMLAQLTSSPQYLDQDIVDKCMQEIYVLTELEDGIFSVLFEAERGRFHTDYFATLENLNKFARLNGAETTIEWVGIQLQSAMDMVCTFYDLPDAVYEYGANGSTIGEIGFSLFRFDQATALRSKRGVLTALDAHYNYNAYTMYNWFTTKQPGELCTQVFAQQYGSLKMDGAYQGNSKARLQVLLYERGIKEHHTMGELSGQTVATFDLDRGTYHSNQTVCMGYSKTVKRWQSELCQSELNVEDVQIGCTCNAFESSLIGVFSDFTRTKGSPVAFPEPIIVEDDSTAQQFAVMPPNIDANSAAESVTSSDGSKDQAEGSVSQAKNGTNFVWMGQTFLVAIFYVIGSLVTRKMDKKDDLNNSLSRTSPIAAAKQNHFIDEVAKALDEPYGAVSLRKASISQYRVLFSKATFPHLMSQLHPMMSPFTSYVATQGRLLRFSLYMLQVNIISAFVYIYFGSVYRMSDTKRNTDVIDQSDIVTVLLAMVTSSFLLTPWLSEPLIKACSNQLVVSENPNTANITQPVLVKSRRKPLRYFLIVMAVLSSIVLPAWAILASEETPASNQYCMATTVIGSLLVATLGTNLLYLWLNSCLARKVAYAPTKKKAGASACLVHYRAIQIVRDMKAVYEVKDQFTLADVLPSSLECSERDVCSHHSNSLAQSLRDNSGSIKLPQHIFNDRTGNDSVNQVEMIDEQENVLGQIKMGCAGEEEKELGTDQDAFGTSNRALNDRVPNFGLVQRCNASESSNDRDESQKNLIASMLKESFVDLDNSRNDVVPQRTQIDDEQFDSLNAVQPNFKNYSSTPPPAVVKNDDTFMVKQHKAMQEVKVGHHDNEAGVKRGTAEHSDVVDEDNEAIQLSSGKKQRNILKAKAYNQDLEGDVSDEYDEGSRGPKIILQ